MNRNILTKREKEVFNLLVTNMSTKEIAEKLNISEKTVKSWKLKEDPESELNITNLRFIKTVSNKTQELNYQNSIYSFQYVSRKEAGFVRIQEKRFSNFRVISWRTC